MSEDIVERLRDRQKLRYMADCKCGFCQLVHIDTVYESADTIDRLRAINAALLAALEHIEERVRGPNDTLKADIAKISRTAIALAKGHS